MEKNWATLKTAIEQFRNEMKDMDDERFSHISSKNASMAAFDSVIDTMNIMEHFFPKN